ncbi:MAG TPA: DNA gyrase inhibitor YacG [Acidobacteriota bacterium]|nr:DNA gyrase inhibitor YacG [Acidobacteriota bacterium]
MASAKSTRFKSYKCPRCGNKTRLEDKYFPFCSKRCRLIDLGKWFNEEYSVQGEEKPWDPADPEQG